MKKRAEVTLYKIPAEVGTIGSEEWTAEGRKMARIDPVGAFETIEVKRAAETATHAALVNGIDARGVATVAHWTAIKDRLDAMGFDVAAHLHKLAQGKVDLAFAGVLLAVGAALTVFVLFAYAPLWLTVLLAFLVVASAAAVEEFFEAHRESSTLREGIFLALAFMALAGQLWLGTLRGVLLGALAPGTDGPATQALGIGAVVLRYALALFSLVAEVVAGYKMWCARSALLSPTAQAVRERDRLALKLFALGDAKERAKAEPEIRHYYRTIGARQQLAWAAGVEERFRANHLKRAFKGAIIAIVFVGLLLFLMSRASAAPVAGRTKAILLDLSRSETVQDLEANIDETTEILGQLHTGDRIIVLGISGEFGRPVVLLEETMPGDAGHYRLQEQAGRETLIAKWKQVSKDLKPTYPNTDIIGALSTLSFLADFAPAGAQIYVLSDMQQSTRELDLEHTSRIPVEQMITKLKHVGGIPSLKGAEVFVLGADPVGKTQTYFTTLKEFWTACFREGGAQLRVFAIDRRIPDLSAH